MKKVKEKETGYLPILYSIGFKPLQSWDVAARNGHIKRIFDEEIQSPAIELVGANVNNTYIYTPCDPSKSLDIKMPLIVLLIKNVSKRLNFSLGSFFLSKWKFWTVRT